MEACESLRLADDRREIDTVLTRSVVDPADAEMVAIEIGPAKLDLRVLRLPGHVRQLHVGVVDTRAVGRIPREEDLTPEIAVLVVNDGDRLAAPVHARRGQFAEPVSKLVDDAARADLTVVHRP